VTELVYRQQLRPVLEDGATAMDRIFGVHQDAALDSSDETPEAVEREGQEDSPDA
jgi:hypothetical protein